MHPLVKKHADTVFAYLFGQISKYEFRERVGKAESKDLWSHVETGYVLVNCKLYLYARHVGKAQGRPVSPARFEISKEDVRTLNAISLDGVSTRHKVYSLFDFRTMETAILTSPEMGVYIGKFISRKLIFLTRSYGQKRSDIEASLKMSGLYALRKQYPFYKSDLHAVNICKSSISNAGLGLIEYWTRDKRNALLKENSDFQAVTVPLDALSNISVQPLHEDTLLMNMQALAAAADKMSAASQAWIATAIGSYDRGFSFYLGYDNTDAVERMPYDKYLDLLSAYRQISKQEMISQLRVALA